MYPNKVFKQIKNGTFVLATYQELLTEEITKISLLTGDILMMITSVV